MPDTNALRILSLDGGGMRGYFSVCGLENFYDIWGRDPKKINKHWNVIAGTSIGGIQALAYAFGHSPTFVRTFFEEDGRWIFTTRTENDIEHHMCSAFSPSFRPDSLDKVYDLFHGIPYYESISSDKCGSGINNYGHKWLEKRLTDIFGDATLSDLTVPVLITSYNQTLDTPVVFSNVDLPGFTGANEKIVDVAMATSAAPTYFPPRILWRTYGDWSQQEYFIDGGVYENNPALLAYSLGKVLSPASRRTCLYSLGTGVSRYTFDPSEAAEPSTSITSILNTILEASMTGGQEAVDFILKNLSSYSLSNIFYYRFQHKFLEAIEMDQSDGEFLEKMFAAASTQTTNDLLKINAFIAHLDA